MNVPRSFWAWLRPATPDPVAVFDDPDRPGGDEQWELWRTQAELAQARALLGEIELYVSWRYVTKQLTTQQKELWADAVDAWEPDPDVPVGRSAERWWNAPELSEQDRREIAAETLADRTRDAGGLE